jgi:hypothetical protein
VREGTWVAACSTVTGLAAAINSPFTHQRLDKYGSCALQTLHNASEWQGTVTRSALHNITVSSDQHVRLRNAAVLLLVSVICRLGMLLLLSVHQRLAT